MSRNIAGKHAVENCGEACTEWNYNTTGREFFP
jgi:hypothetical protein